MRDPDEFNDNWLVGHGKSSPFKGYDMLAEPEPRWPEWLNRWYRQPWLPPKPSKLGVFSEVLRDIYRKPILEEMLRPSSLLTWMEESAADAERTRRRERRAHERALR